MQMVVHASHDHIAIAFQHFTSNRVLPSSTGGGSTSSCDADASKRSKASEKNMEFFLLKCFFG